MVFFMNSSPCKIKLLLYFTLFIARRTKGKIEKKKIFLTGKFRFMGRF